MLSVPRTKEIALSIAEEVAEQIQHDYSRQAVTVLGELDSLDSGKCGHRAALFQKRATEMGLRSRIVIYRGHVSNQVSVNGEWVDVDATRPTNSWHMKLIEHIKSGPVYGYSDHYDYLSHVQYQDFKLGEYSRWLTLLQKRVNLLLPSQLLDGRLLSDKKPNFIIRHDIDSHPEVWMGMVHEENQLGIRSVTYLRVDDETYSFNDCLPLFKMFESEEFEFGLHFNAINGFDIEKEEAHKIYEAQLECAKRALKIRTIQAHGFDNETGIPTYTNYDLEKETHIGFESIVSAMEKWGGRIADSLGVMTPCGVEEYVQKLKRGKLYYALWHPDWYTIKDGWVTFQGTVAQDYDRRKLDSTMKRLNGLVQDTPYFNDAQKPHLQVAAKYLASQIGKGSVIVDFAAGWGTLGLLIHERKHSWPVSNYVAVDNDYRRYKATQRLYQSFRLPFPKQICGDLRGILPQHGDVAVLLGWEGDIKSTEILDYLPQHAPRIMLSYIEKEAYELSWALKYPQDHYCLISRTAIEYYAQKHNLKVKKTFDSTYQDGFPRRIIVFDRLQ